MVFNLRTFSFAESVEDDPPPPPKSFSLKELRRATDNFSGENFLGEGGLGKVYRGRLADGSLVAVKRACTVRQWSKEQFEAEVQVGSTVSTHPNVLCLRGFCRTKKELLLVYPLMINNSLSYNLTGRPDRLSRPLDWTTRKRIALGAARGLAHLHNQGNIKIMHRAINASNILLNVHFEAVIGDCAIAVIMDENNAEEGTIEWYPWPADSGSDSQSYHRYEDVYVNNTTFCGTPGFLAPEYVDSGKCTLKNDVFAYERMLLELMSGTKISELISLSYEHLSLEDWIGDLMNKNELGRVIDPNLQGNYREEEAERLALLALLCSHKNPSIRPEMTKVVRMLESQVLQRDPSTRSSWSQSDGDSTPYYSFPPSPSPSPLGIAP
ncbi:BRASSINOSTEROID INSENSITIVE 1-associated receptor kinase 1-like [Eucalyptus grandis]|uniref:BRASSINOSTEROID INSENSITIVE 1-associated receptor kinase 1-like n=1 Tax=Eucalyptus grandis TaxID=71139 RepID=UPI0005258604|nr:BRASSINOSTEROID INSENSITIVE 1-associated receptor kinase 1-like [Eucalyptus grandis]